MQIYLFTADFPPAERYGLTSQLRRAAVSVAAHLAEGSKRTSPTDKARIFNIAQSEAAAAMSVLDLVERSPTAYRPTIAFAASRCSR